MSKDFICVCQWAEFHFISAQQKYSTIISKHIMRNCKNKSPVAKSVVDLALHYFASVPENNLLLQSCPLLSCYAFYIAFVQNMVLQTTYEI